MAAHSNIFAWKIPWTEELQWRTTVHGVTKSQTRLKWLSITQHTSTRLCLWNPMCGQDIESSLLLLLRSIRTIFPYGRPWDQDFLRLLLGPCLLHEPWRTVVKDHALLDLHQLHSNTSCMCWIQPLSQQKELLRVGGACNFTPHLTWFHPNGLICTFCPHFAKMENNKLKIVVPMIKQWR